MASGGSAPAPADYTGAARAQGQANLDSARLGAQLNRVNQYGPTGSVTYRQVGGSPSSSNSAGSSPYNTIDIPGYGPINLGNYGGAGSPGTGSDQWEQVTALSPEQQAIFNAQQGNQLGLSQLAGMRAGQARNQASLETYNPGDFGAQRDQVTDAQYRASTQMLDPQYAQSGEALRTRLLNSGVREGSEAYTNEMGNFDRSKQAAYGDARDRAIVSGGQEQSRLLTDALRGRQQQVTENQIPLEQAIALMQTLGGGTGGQNPGQIPQVGGPQAPDIQGAVGRQYADQYNQYAADEASASQTNGGLMSLAAMAAAAY